MTDIHNQILPKGTWIGVYEVKDTLQIGAYDITYRAWNHHLKERVEIQEYFPHDFAIRANDGVSVEPKSPADKNNFQYGLEAFQGQAEILMQIEHPNIATVENILQLNGTAYQVMPHQEGVPLSRLVQSPTALAETELRFILVAILNAFQKVHEANIIHAGIQPATIFLDKNGEPLLTRFAAARLAIAAHSANLAGELAGGYAPAEQYEQGAESGPATDFYALGATIYYCMTSRQPADAKSRIAALSKGEPDPIAFLSGSECSAYSLELLQAVNLMLQPEYHNRPQTVAEILVLLKSDYIQDQSKPVSSKQKDVEVADNSPVTSYALGAAIIVGIVALIAVGFWLGEQTSKSLDRKLGGSAATLLPSEDQTDEADEADEAITTLAAQDNQSATLTSSQPGQPDKSRKRDKESVPADIPTAKSELKSKATTEPKADKDQQLVVVDQLLPKLKKNDLQEKPIDDSSIKAHLASAEKAMKEMRLTTPQRDNAYKYYQMVLAMYPDNVEALSGLQKIVDRYIQLITKARDEGRLDEARLYLQRAESVLPGDPRIKSIRTELTLAGENLGFRGRDSGLAQL